MQIKIGTLLLAVLAAALVREITRSPYQERGRMTCEYLLAILLPVLWIGTWRCLGLDGLLVRFAVGAVFVVAFSWTEEFLNNPRLDLLPSSYHRPADFLAIWVGGPVVFLLSIAWYTLTVAGPKPSLNRIRWFTLSATTCVVQFIVEVLLILLFRGLTLWRWDFYISPSLPRPERW